MFEEHGLNVARQTDNGSNPRPDNRSGWLEGETPDVVEELLDTAKTAATIDLEVRLWDPSSQLKFRAKRTVPPRPDGTSNAVPANWGEAAKHSVHAPPERTPETVPAGWGD